MIKVEVLVALKGSRMYPPGEVIEAENRSKLPSEIRGELELKTGTCRVVFEEVPAPRVPVLTVPPAEDEEPPSPAYRAKHRGSGRYVVIEDATGEIVSGDELMTKEEAWELADRMNGPKNEENEEVVAGEAGEHLEEIHETDNAEEASSSETPPQLRVEE